MSDGSEGVPREGEIIAGKYRVERVLGVGGMGVVVAAQHIRLDEKVALKFLLSAALANPEAVARFEREARAASKIKSEHVARVSDVGTLENGSPYMVMEFLQGTDLSGWLEKYGPLPFPQAVDFVLQACEALAEAHSIGIVHRDLKPANLFCIQRSDGELCVKVLDFGISKLTSAGAESVSMTRTTALLGSPLYMSPEQMVTSKAVDARTDIWSLGVILFELVSGRVPFDGQSVTELAIKIAMEAPTPLHTYRPDAPPGFEQLLARCLDKNRDRRFQSVADFAIALADHAPPQSRLSIERIVGTLRRAGGPAIQSAVNGGPGFGRHTGNPATAGSAPQTFGGPPPGVGPQTAASWGHTGPQAEVPPPKSQVGPMLGVVLFGLIAVAATGYFMVPLLKAHSAAATAPVASAPVAPASASASAPAAAAGTSSATPDPSAVPAPPTASAPPVVSATAPTKPEVPAAHVTTAHAPVASPPATPAAAHTSPPAAKAATNCNPPYTVDATGEHHYKHECL